MVAFKRNDQRIKSFSFFCKKNLQYKNTCVNMLLVGILNIFCVKLSNYVSEEKLYLNSLNTEYASHI